METSDKTLLNSVIRMLDALTNDNMHYDTLISVLALLCVLSVVNRPQSKAAPLATPSSSDNPIQKILGQLTKGENGNAPDMLMSLLPLLNNPQLKSKLNPANISSILGMLNSLGGINSEKAPTKPEAPEKAVTAPNITTITQVQNSETTLPPQTNTDTPAAIPADQGEIEKTVTRSLNWKSNF